MRYTVGKKSDNEITYVSDDARIAGNLIDILFDYVDRRVDQNNYTAKYIWKILSASIYHLKNWVNKNDVQILLNKFEDELKNRRK